MKLNLGVFLSTLLFSQTLQAGPLTESLAEKWISPESLSSLQKLPEQEQETLKKALNWIEDQSREWPSRLSVTSTRTYLSCDPVGAQLLLGAKWASCVAIEIAPNRRVGFRAISLHQVELGIGVEFDGGPDQGDHLTSTLELKGLKTLYDVPGTYLSLISSIGSLIGGEMNWVMKKLDGPGYLWLDPRLDKTYLEANYLSAELTILSGENNPVHLFFLEKK